MVEPWDSTPQGLLGYGGPTNLWFCVLYPLKDLELEPQDDPWSHPKWLSQKWFHDDHWQQSQPDPTVPPFLPRKSQPTMTFMTSRGKGFQYRRGRLASRNTPQKGEDLLNGSGRSAVGQRVRDAVGMVLTNEFLESNTNDGIELKRCWLSCSRFKMFFCNPPTRFCLRNVNSYWKSEISVLP